MWIRMRPLDYGDCGMEAAQGEEGITQERRPQIG